MTGRHSAWWEAFFTGLWLEFPLEAHTDEQTRREADRVEELLQLPFREVAWYPAQGPGPFRPVAQPPPLVVATK